MNPPPPITISIASTAPTTAISVTIASSSATSTAITTNQTGYKFSVPPPTPSSQLVVQGSTTNESDTGATGGTTPYKYQWLGSYTNSSGSFSASIGNRLCSNTAQAPVCVFQTAVGNVLSPGTYYLRLQVTDSESPPQVINTSVVFVNVLLNRGGAVTTVTQQSTASTTTVSAGQSSTTTASQGSLTVGQPQSSSPTVTQGQSITIYDNAVGGGTAPYHYQWFVSYTGSSGPYSASTASQLCGNTVQTQTCMISAQATYIMQPGVTHYFKLQVVDSSNPQLMMNSSLLGISVAASCLSGNTSIDSPNGYVNVKDLKVGMFVWTIDSNGNKYQAPIIKVSNMPVPSTHMMVHVVLADGREIYASQGHPTSDGRTFGTLSQGDQLDGSTIKTITLVQYNQPYTYDILPAGGTGFYWADGILIGSTLK